MLRNYLTIAWRNLKRNKISSIINVSGLAVGLACVMLIGMYVKDELGYDRFFNDSQRIFRVKLVVIASFIAFPVAYFAMSKWLQDFAYPTDMNWWVFGIAAFATLIIALATVSFQSVRAALQNPGDSLRSE